MQSISQNPQMTVKARFPSIFTNIVMKSKVRYAEMSQQEIERDGGLLIHGEVILSKQSTIFMPSQSEYEHPRVLLGLVGSKLVKFSDDGNEKIIEQLDVEFWMYQEHQNEKGFSITLISSLNQLILVFSDYKTQQQWGELIQKFTVKLHIKEDFSFSRNLGSGVSSKVYLATEKGKILGKQYAVKSIKKTYFKEFEYSQLQEFKSPVNFESVLKEMRIYRHLVGQDKVMQMYGIYEDLQHLHLVLEYLKGGTLRSYFSKFPQLNEQMLKKVMSQLIKGLQQIHERGVVHRDIKLDNILVGHFDEDNIEVKIADFGLSDQIIYPMTKLHQRCGSPGYIAPEILRSEGYDFKADIFSMGSVFYHVMTKKGLFEGMFKGGLKEFLMANRDCNLSHVPGKLKDSIPGAVEITIKMLAMKPQDRPNAEKLLEMPWIKQLDYSVFSVDEHIEDLLIQVPCLVQFQFEDNMQSLLIGNFNFHDPKSINSGASIIQSQYNGSLRSEVSGGKKEQQSPMENMRLRPMNFNNFGTMGNRESLGSRLNLTAQKLIEQNQKNLSRNQSDLAFVHDFNRQQQQQNLSNGIMLNGRAHSMNYQHPMRSQQLNPNTKPILKGQEEVLQEEQSMESDTVCEVTERKQMVQTVYCSAKIGKYKKESYQMKEIQVFKFASFNKQDEMLLNRYFFINKSHHQNHKQSKNKKQEIIYYFSRRMQGI